MSGESQPLTNREKQARHRVGTTHRLKAIETKLEDLHADVHEILTSVVASRAFVQKGSDYAE